jgi:hypothetical protein
MLDWSAPFILKCIPPELPNSPIPGEKDISEGGKCMGFGKNDLSGHISLYASMI